MTTWKQAARRALYSGSTASILSAIALAACGKLECQRAGAPLNGPSQWVWGRRAAHRRRTSLRYTAVGYTIHHGASLGWAILHEKYLASRPGLRGPVNQLAAGALTAAVACFVDFGVARGRLQPGFDAHLSSRSLAVVYCAFGVGLAIGGLGRRTRRPAAPSVRHAKR